jgi:hypothetical protein
MSKSSEVQALQNTVTSCISIIAVLIDQFGEQTAEGHKVVKINPLDMAMLRDREVVTNQVERGLWEIGLVKKKKEGGESGKGVG